jgi:hypothetical protein
VRDQPGLGAKENEYRCEGTSHAQPGYVLAHQVPPTPSLRSRTTKSSTPSWRKRIASPIPENPLPMMATVVSIPSYVTVSYTSVT